MEPSVDQATCNATERTSWWQPIVEFGVHTIVATFIFLTIAVAAVGVGFFVHYVELWGTSQYLVIGLKCAEYLLFIVDLVLFAVWLVKAAFRAVRSF